MLGTKVLCFSGVFSTFAGDIIIDYSSSEFTYRLDFLAVSNNIGDFVFIGDFFADSANFVCSSITSRGGSSLNYFLI
jgi:hypothetical protein